MWKNALFNGDLEEVYMDIPPGFASATTNNKMCRLKKTMYGLKQSSGELFFRFTNVLKEDGYTHCQADHTLFVKHLRKGKTTTLLCRWYCSYSESRRRNVTHEIFAPEGIRMKDLGQLKYFLGMEVARSSMGISISQRKYGLGLLKEISLLGCKPVDTPMDLNIKVGTGTRKR